MQISKNISTPKTLGKYAKYLIFFRGRCLGLARRMNHHAVPAASAPAAANRVACIHLPGYAKEPVADNSARARYPRHFCAAAFGACGRDICYGLKLAVRRAEGSATLRLLAIC